MDFGAEVWWPLADFATSRGRGAGGTVMPELLAVDRAMMVSSWPLIIPGDQSTFIAITLSRCRGSASLR